MQSHLDLGVKQLEKGEPLKAIQRLTLAINDFPLEARANLAIAHIRLKQWDMAAQVMAEVGNEDSSRCPLKIKITKADKDGFLAMLGNIADPQLRCRLLMQALSHQTFIGKIFHKRTGFRSTSIERGRLKKVVDMLMKEKKLIVDKETRKILDKTLDAELQKHAPRLAKLLKTSGVIPLPRAPRKVAPEDLTDEGRLEVTMREEIIAIIRDRMKKDPSHKAGRVEKHQVFELHQKRPSCAAEYFINEHNQLEIYWLYKGKKHFHKNSPEGRLAGEGGRGRVKIAQKEVVDDKKENKDALAQDFDWFGVKLKPVDENKDSVANDNEFKVGKNQGIAFRRLVRPSPSHANKMQEEIVMKLLPGKSLDTIIETKSMLHPLFLLNIFADMLDKLIQFLEKNQSLHRDLKPGNFIIFGLIASLIDFDGAVKWVSPTNQSVDVDIKDTIGTPGFFSKEMLFREVGKSHHDIYTEMFSMGLIIGMASGLITPESIDSLFKHYNVRYLSLFMDPPSYKLMTDTHPDFKSKTNFADEKLRREVLDFARRMVQADLFVAPPKDFHECFRFFRQKADQVRETAVLRVCLIDVNEFIESDFPIQKLMIENAKQFDIVQLVKCTDKHKPLQYMMAERIFDDELKNLFGQNLINLADYPVSDLRTLISQCSDWYPKGKNYEFTFLNNGSMRSEENALRLQGIRLSPVAPVADQKAERGLGL